MPYPGDPKLSRKNAGKLRAYVESLQPGIYRKISAVFPGTDNLK